MTVAVDQLYRATWIVAHVDGEHRLLRDGYLGISGDTIVHVGAEPPEGHDPADAEVYPGILAPGLISTHAHINESPADKTLVEDVTRKQFWGSALFDVLPVRSGPMTEEDRLAYTELSLAEHLLTGCTTVMHMGAPQDTLVDAVDRSGIRAYLGTSYRSGRWLSRDGRRVSYEWFDDDGTSGLERAVAEIRDFQAAGNSRISGWLNPSQVDTCSAELLAESQRAARDLDVPLTIHAAQSVVEFHEMVGRYGRSPIEWLADIDFLDERVIIGHGIFLAGGPTIGYGGDDLGILADTGASVSYSAWTFARGGAIMQSFEDYRRRGVDVLLGTDSATQSMMESLRWTAVLGKVAKGRPESVSAAEVFSAATHVTADRLGRPDLGRLAPGARADILFFRMDTPTMVPSRDPVKTIVYYAQPEDLQHVMVDGRHVVRDREVLTLDVRDAAARSQAGGERIWNEWSDHDPRGRSIEERMPLSYRSMSED